jgi:hypothetical protein
VTDQTPPLIVAPADVYRQWTAVTVMLPTWGVEVLWKGLDNVRRVGYLTKDRVLHLRTIDNTHVDSNLRAYTYWRPFLL